MKKIVIEYSDYAEETNDPDERRKCKLDGPRYLDDEGYFRVPRTGFVRNGVEYELRGFGKLDRRPGKAIDIPEEATLWFSKRMGHAYIPYFVKDRDLRLRISTYIKLKGWISLKMAIESLQKEMTIVKEIGRAHV